MEIQALDCACVFDTSKEAARYIGINYRTVEAHLSRAYNKMGVRQFGGSARVHAMRLWLAYHGTIVL